MTPARARAAAEAAFDADAEPDRGRGRPRVLKQGARVRLPSGALAAVIEICEDADGQYVALLREDGEPIEIRPAHLRWPNGGRI